MPAAQTSADPLSRVRERVRVRARELRQSSPDAERAIWNALRNRQLDGYKFRRQHPIGAYFADFACVEAMLVVELDGGQHFEPKALDADARRTRALNGNGFQVLRFDDRQALAGRESVLTSILDWLRIHHPHPNPLPLAGEGVNTHPLPQAREGAQTENPRTEP
jgi:very-short-patch-repair endonuclease